MIEAAVKPAVINITGRYRALEQLGTLQKP
jgi:hypothetical protein